jgi:hypothetical protein
MSSTAARIAAGPIVAVEPGFDALEFPLRKVSSTQNGYDGAT